MSDIDASSDINSITPVTIYTQLGALALMAGALLNMVRMVPIYLHGQVDFDGYPPKNLEETVEIAQLTGYYISHAIVFFATPLFLIGYYALYKDLKRFTTNIGLTVSLIGFSIGQLLYLIGVVLHGLVLPQMANQYVAVTLEEQIAMAPLFDFNHQLATSFGGLGFAFLLICTGILGVFLRLRNKLFGYIAISIGLLAAIGYPAGILDLTLFRSFALTAGFITVMFVFYFILGTKLLLSSSKSSANATLLENQ